MTVQTAEITRRSADLRRPARAARSHRPRRAGRLGAAGRARRRPGGQAGRAAGAHRGAHRRRTRCARRSRWSARPRSRCRWPSASWRAPSGWSRAARWPSASSSRRATPPCSRARSATTRSRGWPRRARRSTTATVRAPISGLVARRHVNRGDVVSSGTELYTIIDPSSMRLEASVPSEQLGAITIGATVNFQVRGYPGQTLCRAHRAHQPDGRSGDAAGADLRDDPQHAGPAGRGPVRRRARGAGGQAARWSCR